MSFKMFDDDDWRLYLALLAAGLIAIPKKHQKEPPHTEVKRPIYFNPVPPLIMGTSMPSTDLSSGSRFIRVL